MARFHQALREASTVASVSATSIAGSFLKAQTEILGGFAAIGTAALGLVDKVAMADQQYRLFALHMYMSKDAARGLKVAMDALGEPLENLTWDKELRDRTHQLMMDQQAMAPNGDFDAQMQKVRDIRFEFTRMEVEGQYLAMHVVQDFMKGLGFGPDELLKKLRQFNDWVINDMPQISAKLVGMFMPVWNDLKNVALATGKAMEAVGLAFTNIVGAMTGDKAIQGATFDFEKFAGALVHVVHWFAIFAEVVDKLVEGVANLAAGLAQLFGLIPAPVLDAIIGGVGGTLVGGPIGGVAGALGGAALGAFGGGGSHVASGEGSVSSGSAASLVQKYAAQFGVNSSLAMALAMQESSLNPDAIGRNPNGTPSGAVGIMQVTRGTAKALGIDQNNPDQNVRGGMQLFAHLLQKYGDAPTAIAAYHDGEGRVNAALAGRATLSSEATDEVARVMRRTGASGDVHIGSIVVHIDKKNATNDDVATAIANKVRDTKNKQVQRNLAEFQDLSWSS